MKFYYDERGRYAGHSSGLVTQVIKFFFGVFMLALVLGWPLLVHGPAGIAMEVVWVIMLTIVAFLWVSSRAGKGTHKAPRGAAPAGESEPVNSRKEWLPYTGPDRW